MRLRWLKDAFRFDGIQDDEIHPDSDLIAGPEKIQISLGDFKVRNEVNT